MNWEQAKKMLEMQGITPTERDRALLEMGFISHILCPTKRDTWGRETVLMAAVHVEEQ